MSDDYEVGYGKPPKGTRFRKGVCYNHRGRRPKSKNIKTLLQVALDEKLSVEIQGTRRSISKREVLVLNLVNRALKCDPKALAVIIPILGDGKEPEPFELQVDDEEMLAQWFREMTSAEEAKASKL